ncbi:MAG: rRNA methyltransferase [Gammaproteobacteria bacterium]|jgi:16S rRNA (guanine1516-N2)-methyltransferase|nr:rRNA methyltransferase [Gammaproteobacteria bacterium]
MNTLSTAYTLCQQEDKLTLVCPHLKPFSIDFCQGKLAYRLKHETSTHQPIARAVGIKPGYRPRIVDLTAGFGQDGVILANLGCQVTLVERHPIIFALLADGLKRAQENKEPWAHRVTVIHQDAKDYCEFLLNNTEGKNAVDTVYCDPMFPQKKSCAKVQKNMQILQELAGQDDNTCLLSLACKIAQKRVVVKRPMQAVPLENKKPDFCIRMIKYRFDIYLPPY